MRHILASFVAIMIAAVMLLGFSSGVFQTSASPMGQYSENTESYENIIHDAEQYKDDKDLYFYECSTYEYTYYDDDPSEMTTPPEPPYDCDSNVTDTEEQPYETTPPEPPYDCDSDVSYTEEQPYETTPPKPPYDNGYGLDEPYELTLPELPDDEYLDDDIPYDIIIDWLYEEMVLHENIYLPLVENNLAIISIGPPLNMPQGTFILSEAFSINGFTLDALDNIIISTIRDGSEWYSTAPITNREQLSSLWHNLSLVEVTPTWRNPEMFTDEHITIDFQFVNPNWSVGIQVYGQVAVFGQGPFMFSNGMSTRDFMTMFKR